MQDPIELVRQLPDTELVRYARILAAKVATGRAGAGTAPALAAVTRVIAERGLPAPTPVRVIHDERFRWTGPQHWGRRRMRPGDRPEPPVAA